jgi:hypothetical protein
VRNLFVPTAPDNDDGDEHTALGGGRSVAPGRRRLIGSTLISSFRTELGELCAALEARECRHIRCLRPNDKQEPLQFDRASMLRQCRYSGLLEATRIRRFGYAHRRSLTSFAVRYADLIPEFDYAHESYGRAALKDARRCAAICAAARAAGVAQDELCVGQTKVFLRASGLAWLELKRERLTAAHVKAAARRWAAMWHIQRLRRSTLILQAYARGFLARREARRRRKRWAVQLQEAAASAAQQSPSSTYRGVRGIPLSAPAGYERLPGSARRQLANKWGDALAMGALARTSARSPRGAPSAGTKRRPGAVRASSVGEKENEEPFRNELTGRNRTPRHASVQKSPSSASASPTGQCRPPRQASNHSVPVVAALLASVSGPRAGSPSRRQATRDFSAVSLGPRSIREPWASRGLAAAAAEAIGQPTIAAAQPRATTSVQSPRCHGTGTHGSGSLAAKGSQPLGSARQCSPPTSARSYSAKHIDSKGPATPRMGSRDLSPRRHQTSVNKQPFRAGIPSGKTNIGFGRLH